MNLRLRLGRRGLLAIASAVLAIVVGIFLFCWPDSLETKFAAIPLGAPWETLGLYVGVGMEGTEIRGGWGGTAGFPIPEFSQAFDRYIAVPNSGVNGFGLAVREPDGALPGRQILVWVNGEGKIWRKEVLRPGRAEIWDHWKSKFGL